MISLLGFTTVKALRSGFKWRYDHPGDLIYAPLLLKQLSDMMPDSSIVSTDVGQHQMWAHSISNRVCHKTSSRQRSRHDGLWFTCGDGRSGRSSGKTNRILVSGDGSFMMNVPELGT